MTNKHIAMMMPPIRRSGLRPTRSTSPKDTMMKSNRMPEVKSFRNKGSAWRSNHPRSELAFSDEQDWITEASKGFEYPANPKKVVAYPKTKPIPRNYTG
jgi:hypothetical protein